jgi:organic radical activating enzyme
MSTDKFCPLPFIHISSTNDSNYRICCSTDEQVILKDDGTPYNIQRDSVVEVWNSDYYKKIRSDLLNGVETPACGFCWRQEANGVFSKRQQSIEELKNYYTRGVTEPVPTMLDLKVGTLCNLKCITCFPGASSQHQAESDNWKKHGEEVPMLIKLFDESIKKFNLDVRNYNPKTVDVESYIQNIDPSLKAAKGISLVGGEPLLNPFAKSIIKHCVEKGYAKNTMMTMITNLSTLDSEILDNLSKYQHPSLMVSYDHIDADKFKFIRFPADYLEFYNNFRTLLTYTNIHVKLSTTISIFNVFDLPEILTHFEQLSQEYKKRFIVNAQFVVVPDYFSIKYLPQQHKDTILKKITAFVKDNENFKLFNENPDMLQVINSIGNFMNSSLENYDTVVAEQQRVLALYDRTRNTDFASLFPQLVQ